MHVGLTHHEIIEVKFEGKIITDPVPKEVSEITVFCQVKPSMCWAFL
jgi:hypothetical protein